jgi:predicted phosphate transport protein (TIGR00153 family)
MLDYIFAKRQAVESLILQYLELLSQARKVFDDALAIFLDHSHRQDFAALVEETHRHESKADDVLLQINEMMYGEALQMESRGDIMRVLASIDKITEIFERILYKIQIEKLDLPEFMRAATREFVISSLEACDLLQTQLQCLFNGEPGIRDLLSRIDAQESRCDRIERKLLAMIFDSDLDHYAKLQLRDLIAGIGTLSDQADRVSKLVNILNLKMRGQA